MSWSRTPSPTTRASSLRSEKEPDDEVMQTLVRALRDHPELQERSAEYVAQYLVRSGYLSEEPSLTLVAETLGNLKG